MSFHGPDLGYTTVRLRLCCEGAWTRLAVAPLW